MNSDINGPTPLRFSASSDSNSFPTYNEEPLSNRGSDASPSSTNTYSVADVATMLGLKPSGDNNEWHGPNPTGHGAKRDGFMVFAQGNAYDRSTQEKFTSAQVAKLAGIPPIQYQPYAESRSKSFPLNQLQRARRTQHQTPRISKTNFDWNKAKIYNYLDANKKLIFQVGRIDHSMGHKDFRQRRLDKAGKWINNLNKIERPLYNLPDVLQASTVILCEGEKVADEINKHLRICNDYGDIVASTTSQGSGSFHKTDTTPLNGKLVVIMPDNDAPGEKYQDGILDTLKERATLKVINLPNRGEGGDYVDYQDAGGTIEEVLRLIEQSPLWQPPQPKPAFEIFTLKDLENIPRLPWLIRDLLQAGTTSVLSADSGSYKSFFALDTALCVATGKEFHGREVEAGTVVYVAAEGFHTLAERVLAWLLHHNRSKPDNFHIIRVPVEMLIPDVIEKFIAQIEALQPIFIVLDTLSQCAAGANENDNGTMAMFVKSMMAVAQRTGAHVQTLHHNAKSSGQLRGATSIKANIDAAISLERSEDKESNRVLVRCEKQRGRPFQDFVLQAVEVATNLTDEFGELVTSLVFELCDEVITGQQPMDARKRRVNQVQEKLLEVFDEVSIEAEKFGGGVMSGSWFGAVEKLNPTLCKRASFFNHLKALEQMGTIEKFGYYGSSALYRRTPTSPSNPNESKCAVPTPQSIHSNNPLGVGVDGLVGAATEVKAHTYTNGASNNKTSARVTPPLSTIQTRKQLATDSEPYQSWRASDNLGDTNFDAAKNTTQNGMTDEEMEEARGIDF